MAKSESINEVNEIAESENIDSEIAESISNRQKKIDNKKVEIKKLLSICRNSLKSLKENLDLITELNDLIAITSSLTATINQMQEYLTEK